MLKYSQDAIEQAKQDAAEWLEDNANGYPRSWSEVEAREEKEQMYDPEWHAPPIARYEALEKEGKVVRIGPVRHPHGDERIHFKLVVTK